MNRKIALSIVLLMIAVCVYSAEVSESLSRLIAGNNAFIESTHNPADISAAIRKDTADNGQHPFAVVVTCSDSRVPPEHIFMAGIGELFVIRTAGNVIGDFELGSIEYGVEHLGADIIVILGHSACGAVAASMGEGHADGNIQAIVNEIRPQILSANNSRDAEISNITHSYDQILKSDIVSHMVAEKKVEIVKARYDILSGKVDFLE